MRRYRFIMLALATIVVTACHSIDPDTDAYIDAVSSVCVEWEADKQTVSAFMEGWELKAEGRDYMDFYLPDEDYLVTYVFYDGKMESGALIVPESRPVTFSHVLKKYTYVGMTVIFNPDTDHAELYADQGRNLMLALYSEEYAGISYNILGFTPLKKQ